MPYIIDSNNDKRAENQSIYEIITDERKCNDSFKKFQKNLQKGQFEILINCDLELSDLVYWKVF